MKRNIISVAILALLIVNIVLTAIMMFSVTSTNRKTADLVRDIAAAVSIDLGGGQTAVGAAPSVDMAHIEPYTIADMTIPLKKSVNENGEEETHYAVLSVTLSMDNSHHDYKTYGDLSAREDLIRGKINDVVSQFTMEEAQGNPQMVKNEILKGIQSMFDSDFIFDVTLSSSLYQ